MDESTTFSIDQLPDFLKPRLRLFLSVDVVNSTAFKQSVAKDGKQAKSDEVGLAEPWFSPISKFYRRIEELFSQQWVRLSNILLDGYDWPIGNSPELWKAAGDELLYVKELSDYREALVTIRAWIETINKHREELKSEYPMLDLKATAWIAGFPVNNTEVVFRPSLVPVEPDPLSEGDPVLSNLIRLKEHYADQRKGFRDFIGPSIDTGFRVAQLATSRKMAITVDLALMLAHATVNQPNDEDFPLKKLEFHYDGRIPLKGVLDGTAYPFFWIDAANKDPLTKVEDELTNIQTVGASEVKTFCELFIAKIGRGGLIKPFISGSTEPLFSTIPIYHQNRLEKLARYSLNELKHREIESQSLMGTTEPEDDSNADSLTEVQAESMVHQMLPKPSS